MSGLPYVELDLLRYRRDWQEVATEDFRDKVAFVADGDEWIMDGNYSAVRELTWRRADLVVWLDYSLLVVLWRILRRTARRLVTAEEFGNENREQLRRILGRRSIILWAIQSHAPLRKEYEISVGALKSDVPLVVRLRSPREAGSWLWTVRRVGSEGGDGQMTGLGLPAPSEGAC